MATIATINKIKTSLRITHNALDAELSDTIDACLADLVMCGIKSPDEADSLILAAIKNYCRAEYTDDTDKAAEYLKRYEAQKSCLQIASGYGGAEQ